MTSLTLCVFSSLSSWEPGGPLPLFRIHYFLLFFSLPAFLPLSVMQRLIHSYIHTHIHSHPHIHVVLSLSLHPLHGFVLQPQWQGPGDEVTLHRRAAGLTEPRPSPPSSSAQRTNSSLTSPSTVLRFLCSDKFTYMPMQTTGRTHTSFFRSSY